MRFALFLLIAAVPLLASAADDQSDLPPELRSEDVSVGMSASPSLSDPILETRIAQLEEWAQETTDYLKRDQAGEEERIRRIARDEIRKAQLSVRTSSGGVVQRQVSTFQGDSGVFELNPGETLVAIDGVPVNQTSYQGRQGPVRRLQAGRFEARTYAQPRRATTRYWMQNCSSGQRGI